jgi:predicted enzyme related to lactoylglutathione lyase
MSALSGRICGMRSISLFQRIDAVTVAVPDLDSGLRFYQDCLGHELLWRHDDIGQAGPRMPGSDTEIVLATGQEYAPNWLVTSADEAARVVASAGGRVLTRPFDIPVGRAGAAVVADPFGNVLVMLDLSKGRYLTDSTGQVTGVTSDPPAGIQ